LGDTVAATITLHHLELTIDDVGGKNHHFCKPIAKFPEDREALIQIIREGFIFYFFIFSFSFSFLFAFFIKC